MTSTLLQAVVYQFSMLGLTSPALKLAAAWLNERELQEADCECCAVLLPYCESLLPCSCDRLISVACLCPVTWCSGTAMQHLQHHALEVHRAHG